MENLRKSKRYLFNRSIVNRFPVLLRTFSLLPASFFIPHSKASVQQEIDYAVHANIVYHFTKYINWPEHRKYGDFVIGVVGESPLYDELKELVVGKTVGKQKIIVTRFSAFQKTYDAHILFIPEDETNNLKKIVNKTLTLPVLIVSEKEGSPVRGTCINFVIVNSRLSLEISKKNIQARNLNIASELLALGKIVN